METKHTINIICPHCGNEDDQYWENDIDFDDFNEMQCISCEETFYVKVWNPIYFTSAKTESKLRDS